MTNVLASWVAYIDDFKLLMLLSLSVMPLLVFIKTPPPKPNDEPMPVVGSSSDCRAYP